MEVQPHTKSFFFFFFRCSPVFETFFSWMFFLAVLLGVAVMLLAGLNLEFQKLLDFGRPPSAASAAAAGSARRA